MKIRKERKDGPVEASSQRAGYYTIECIGCGKFIKKIKKQKETIKHSFECPSCTSKFSITFPGIDESKENWLAGHGDDWTNGRLR